MARASCAARNAGSAARTSTRFRYIRGKYVIMGDCDCTYDFRDIAPFLEAFRRGAEFVMGSRFKGTIDPGAMPPLHQYFGTPLTTLHPQHHVRLPLQRHPLRHAGPHARRLQEARAAIAEVGIRVRDDHQGGEARPADRRGAHPLPEGHGRSARATSRPAGTHRGSRVGRTFACSFSSDPISSCASPAGSCSGSGALLVFRARLRTRVQIGRHGISRFTAQVVGLFFSRSERAFVGLDALTTLHLKFDRRTVQPRFVAPTTTTSSRRSASSRSSRGTIISSSFVARLGARRFQGFPPVARLRRRTRPDAARAFSSSLKTLTITLFGFGTPIEDVPPKSRR